MQRICSTPWQNTASISNRRDAGGGEVRNSVIEEPVQLCCLSDTFAIHWHEFSLLTQMSMRTLVPSILLPSEGATLLREEELGSNTRRPSLVESTFAPQAAQSRFQHNALLALDNTRM
jgi:hypothetical protein